jgi:hypothetical protein
MKRYLDAGVDEIALPQFALPATEPEMITQLEKIAREWVEPASKL